MDIDIQSQDMADAALQTSDEMMRLGDVADLLSKMKFAKWVEILFSFLEINFSDYPIQLARRALHQTWI
jgi:hypothetical protein